MIKQRNYKDCGICSLAMLLDKPYHVINKDVRSLHKIKYPNKKFDGIDDTIEQMIAWKHGFKFKTHVDIDWKFDFKKGYWAKVAGKKYNIKKLVGNKKSILSVPSINFKGYGHCIYWDGEKLHDPSNLKRYTAKSAFKHAFRALVIE